MIGQIEESARNCIFQRSVKVNHLCTEPSMFSNPGPQHTAAATLPGLPTPGAANSAVSKKVDVVPFTLSRHPSA